MSAKTKTSSKYNGFAIAGFVTSFISPAILGLIFSVIGLREARANQEKGEGLAIAGIAISSVSLLFSVVVLILFLTGLGASIHLAGKISGDYEYLYTEDCAANTIICQAECTEDDKGQTCEVNGSKVVIHNPFKNSAAQTE